LAAKQGNKNVMANISLGAKIIKMKRGIACLALQARPFLKKKWAAAPKKGRTC